MTFQEMNLKIFRGKEIPQVLFQPGIESWYAWHKDLNLLPLEYKNKTLLDLFDDLKVSMRYVNYYTGMPDPVEIKYTSKVRRKEKRVKNETRIIIIETPYGQLVEEQKFTQDRTWRTIDFAVKEVDDFKKLRWLYQNTIFTFSIENFKKGSQFIAERGEPQFWVPKSPYQALCQQWMRMESFIYALADNRKEVEETMKVIDKSYDRLYEEIINSKTVKIINSGENIHVQLLSPRYFENYLLPFYQKRSNQLRKSGIFTHIHIDGFFKPLLKYFRYLPFDGLEALTPLPQGDTAIEQIKEHIGDKVLLDGIPAVFFLPTCPEEEVEKCVTKLVKLFYPKLILGISDELPEGAEEEAINRVRWISNYCQNYKR